MRVLVTAATRHGATQGIADALAARLAAAGLAVDAVPVERVTTLEGYGAVVLGSAVYYGHWLEAATAFVDAHGGALAALPVWLFSSGPLGQPGHELPEGEAVDVAAVLAATGAVAHRTFAGRLDRTALPFRERAIATALRAPQGDFRDWAAVDAYADEIAAALATSGGDTGP